MELVAHEAGVRAGDRRLFGGVHLRAAPGLGVVVRGPSGSGKTTLLRALADLRPLEEGRVTLDGRGPHEWGPRQWRAQVHYVPQRPPAHPGTPAELAQAVRRLRSQRHREGDDPVAIASRWHVEPRLWGEPWSTLSGGEQQRVQLALALARRPAVLLLDEPTSALDPEATRAVMADLAQTAFVWVSHDPATAERLGVPVVELPR